MICSHTMLSNARRLLRMLIVLLILLTAGRVGAPACLAANGGEAPAAVAVPECLAPQLAGLMQAYRADVERLASPEFGGRRVGEPGCELATQYLEGRLKKLGAEPAPGQKGYRQGFSVTRGITVKGQPSVVLNGVPLKLGEDYAVAAFSGSGKADAAPLVFAGYGITAPELKWDDYAGIDVKGAAVVIVRGEPQEKDKKSIFAGDQLTVYSDVRRKAANARDHGAVAVLLVDNLNMNPDDKLAGVHPLYSAASFDLPVLHVRRMLLQNSLIGGTGLSFPEMLETIDLEGQPHSAKLSGAVLSVSIEVEKDLVTGFNLIGVIPGADEQLQGQYVAVGAHYDHLGLGGPESMAPQSYGQVHPGADDDASGVAGVLAIGAWAVQNRAAFKRSLLLCLFSGEEEGLLGSSAMMKNPPVPPGSITSLVDMDMIGRLRNGRIFLGATGTAAEFESLLAGLPGQFGLQTSEDKSGIGGSDFLSFTRAGIPSVFVFTGAHPQYHTPQDTPDLVNYDGAEQVLDFVVAITERLCDYGGALTFQNPSGQAQARPQTSSLSVSMGTIPAYGEEASQPGYLIGDIRPGGPADQAGIKAGDLVVKIMDRRIANIYDFMFVLQDCQPNQTVPVTVIRGGQALEFQVTLAAKAVQQ